MKKIVIIPSGGKGLRLGTDIPKQYVKVNNKELIAYTIDVFEQCDEIDEIVIAAQKDYFDLLNKIIKKYSFKKVLKIVEGGKERQDSVYNALSSLSASNRDLILVHDAARPLLPQKVLLSALQSAENFDNVVVGIKAKDTLIKGSDSVLSYVDRSEIFYAQTPQIFRYGILKSAMEKAIRKSFIGTDESMLVHKASYKVKLVEGSVFNFKVTTKDDLDLFTSLVNNKLY
ncbi:MAG: 2-C-methyl-D-erythritol 4-phosphate cytidylyltransferase [Melioribacteraceae bacterium]|jgi:2-C-methyl-D-erythritol 4-phosphate cytidylyltransferase|nr:2-C-methyl-D-erythritol 4-phosphate cytidylyltransferase [Melioribacteraceae bacterium]